MSNEIAAFDDAGKERQRSRKRPRQPEAKPDAPALPIQHAFDDEFDEAEYLLQHPEVADAIAEGHLPNALFHFRVFSTKPRAVAEAVRREPTAPGSEPRSCRSPKRSRHREYP